jgi:hypothetical protein
MKITFNGIFKLVPPGGYHRDKVSRMEDPVVFTHVEWLVLPDPLENTVMVTVWRCIQGF